MSGLRWGTKDYEAHLAKKGAVGSRNTADTSAPPFALPVEKPGRGRLALGRLKTGEMNKTEARYAEHLESLRRTDALVWFKFEGIKLRLADNTFLTVDFAVMCNDGVLEMHEVKGYWEDDARVKIKVAASLYPFRFIAVTPQSKKDGGGWKVEEF